MSKLIIKLDDFALYCVVVEGQLIMADELPADNVSQILSRIGDLPISEICVYMKFDTRQDVEGIIVDRMEVGDKSYTFRVSEADYSFLKALALRLNVPEFKFFSAYRHYCGLLENGVVVDSYAGRSFVVADIKEGQCLSLNVCAHECLQRTVERCRKTEIIYASHAAIPGLKNIENIPPEFYETLTFLQHVETAEPCYASDVCVVEETPSSPLPPLEPAVIEDVQLKLNTPVPTKSKVMNAFIWSVAGIVFALGLIGLIKGEPGVRALETKTAEQVILMERQKVEEDFMKFAVANHESVHFARRLSELHELVKSGMVISVRFVSGNVEVTLFTLDEVMKDKVIEELSQRYFIVSQEFEKQVKNSKTGAVYFQYHLVLRINNEE